MTGRENLSSPACGGGPADGRGGGVRQDETQSRKLAKSLRKNLTNAETILWSRLRRHPLFKFRRQHPIGPYVADFACVAARLVVEVDGATHSSDTELRHDATRDAFMRRNGWRVLRVWNGDIYKTLSNVLDYIDAAVAVPPPSRYARHLPHK
jgi:very-short-patch-repair endonuclease